MLRRQGSVVLVVLAGSIAIASGAAERRPPVAKTAVVVPTESVPKPMVNTGVDRCTGATVLATYSPKLEFGLDGQQLSPSMFTAEVVRRNAGKPMRCMIVMASCRDAMLSKQIFRTLKPYGVTHISWQPDRKLFPKSTSKMPECKSEPN